MGHQEFAHASPNWFIRYGGLVAAGLREIREKLFPERQVLLRSSRSVRSLALPGWLQAMIVAACLTTFGGVTYLTVGYFALQRSLDQIAASGAATSLGDANRQLEVINDQYAALKSRYDALAAQQTGSPDANRQDLERKLKDAQAKMATPNGDVVQLQKSLDDLRAQLKQSESARLAEQGRNKDLQVQMETLQARANLLKALVDAKDQQLQQLSSGRTTSDKTSMATPPVAPPAQSPDALAAANDNPLVDNPDWDAPVQQAALETGNDRPMSELERLIASTGIDLDRLLRSLGGGPPGQGGPFIAADGMRNSTLDAARNAELQKLIKTLPLASPLGHYEVESPFGIRRDPFNGREAFHSGIDLGAYYRAPVYSTGPGVVSFTGVKGSYGRVVEIDHGHGIVTRYAHLHRILVARGQRIGAHVEVGELGSTGRSTGPHLHYEVMLDGRPVDPNKFLEAGKNVVRASAK